MDTARAVAYSCAFLALGAIGVALAINGDEENIFTVCFAMVIVTLFFYHDVPKKS